MKKLLPLMIATVLILSGLGTIADTNNNTYVEKTKEESIVVSQPIINNLDQYVSVNFDEATSHILDIGKPMLPVFTKVFILPFGSKINSVDVSFSNENEITISKQVQPAPEPVPMDSIAANSNDPIKDETVYGSSELYPSTGFTYSTGAGLQDNEHVIFLTVRCFPVRYSPMLNKLYYSKDINIQVFYDEPSAPASFNDEYDLVIITPSKFSDDLEQLKDHKNQYGINTIIKTTEEIYSEYNGYDNAEEIKYFLKDAVENWDVKYALLVGDIYLLPIRMTAIHAWQEEELPSDLYYADIYDSEGQFCSWDSNQNGDFSEWDRHDGPIDDVDLYPDINIGRLPCSNRLDVLITVKKIIEYETQSNGQQWCNKAVMLGGDTFPGHGVYEGEVTTEEVSKQIPEFNTVKLWTSTNNFRPLTINQEISSGACFVSYSGHGYQNGFGTSPPNEEDRIEYFTPYLLGMLNSKKYPIIFFDACLTATLDYNVLGIKLPTFAWSLVKKLIGGAVATIGATRTAYTYVDETGVHGGAGYLNVHFFKAYEPGIFVSEMLTSTQNDYLNYIGPDFLTLEEFLLIGDPSLKVGGYTTNGGFSLSINEPDEGLNGYPNTPVQLQAIITNIDQPYTVSWDLNDDNIFDDATGETIEKIWNSQGTYPIGVKVTAENNYRTYKTIVNIQSKPDTIIGPTSGKNNKEYTYTITSNNNPSYNEIYYLVDWGDGTYSDILGPISPNEQLETTHTWYKTGIYQIKIKTMSINTGDYSSEESGWSDPLPVSISKDKKSKTYQYSMFLEQILQHFPRIEYLIHFILTL